MLHLSYYQGERIVNVGGTECPCGGTHIKNTSWIGAMVVTKMKKVSKILTLCVYVHISCVHILYVHILYVCI